MGLAPLPSPLTSEIKIETGGAQATKALKGTRWLTSKAKLAADARTRCSGSMGGQVRKRKFPLPRFLANVKRGFSEKKWAEAKGWAKERLTASTAPVKRRSGVRRWRVPTSALPLLPAQDEAR